MNFAFDLYLFSFVGIVVGSAIGVVLNWLTEAASPKVRSFLKSEMKRLAHPGFRDHSLHQK